LRSEVLIISTCVENWYLGHGKVRRAVVHFLFAGSITHREDHALIEENEGMGMENQSDGIPYRLPNGMAAILA
jgi:hypothetical protein